MMPPLDLGPLGPEPPEVPTQDEAQVSALSMSDLVRAPMDVVAKQASLSCEESSIYVKIVKPMVNTLLAPWPKMWPPTSSTVTSLSLISAPCPGAVWSPSSLCSSAFISTTGCRESENL